MKTKSPSAPAVVRKWKRLLAVGCSHGDLIDHHAAGQVLRFQKKWCPHTTLHLGDFLDTAAFRSGAAGTSDESRDIAPDFNEGLGFLRKLNPDLIFVGNHEHRLWKLQMSPRAIVAELAENLVGEIRRTAKDCRAELIETYSISSAASWRTLGGYKFGHGFMYSESATRDHAEAFGNCVHAHTHRPCVATARRSDQAKGYGVGTLSSIPLMDYAGTRRQTLAWAAGFVWGEYCDNEAVLWLHEQPRGEQEWRLPV